MNVQFLTGSSSKKLSSKENNAYIVPIVQGSLYFTTDNKIYYDVTSTERICMNEYAVRDFDGNAITDTYATKEELAAINDKFSDMLYEPIDITSFSNSIGYAELGNVITAITFSWKTNKTPTALWLNGDKIDAEKISQTLTGIALSASSPTTSTFSLRAIDEREAEDSATTSIQFCNGVYCGVLAGENNRDILSLTKRLQTSRAMTFITTAKSDQYIYYACPARLGVPSFNVGGFDGGFGLLDTIRFTNAFGYTENYYLYRSDNIGLGQQTVKVT